MKPVLIDVTRLLGRLMKGRLPTGVDRVCQAYVEHYGAGGRAVLQKGRWGAVLPRRESQALFAMIGAPGDDFRQRAVGLLPRALAAAVTGHERVVRADRDAAGMPLFNVGHSGLERAGYAPWLARHGVRPVYMVHDLIPITHPEFCRPGERARHERRMDVVLTTAAAVVTNSRATLDELGRYAAACDLPMPPAVAALLGADAVRGEVGPRPIEAPYFVTLGTIEARKNHLLLLQVWRRLVDQLGAAAPRLVVIGQRGWECENAVDYLERCAQLRGIVVERSTCSDRELATYLQHAQALLFPSFVEGYGLPLVEALSLNVPVIASDLPVFREIAGMAPDYLDPLDGPAWLACIADYADSGSRRRAAQLSRIADFASPTWKAHFAVLDDFLGRLG